MIQSLVAFGVRSLMTEASQNISAEYPTSLKVCQISEKQDTQCKGMWKESVCSFKGIWSRTFSMQKGIVRKGGSHKQEHTETQI